MSQIIPLGIGSPAGITQLVLTGLSPGVLPPPPVPGSGGQFRLIGPGEVVYSFQNVTSTVYTDGIEYTLPVRAIQITWQTKYATEPAQTEIELQVSLDGSNWVSIDSTTEVAGEIRTIRTSAIFVRAAMLDITPGIVTSVSLRVQPAEWFD